jgi:large subunit ribosomal protein L24
MKSKIKIKKNDQVLVIAGKDRGARGRVLRVLPSRHMAIVERVNMLKRHTRPNPQRGIQGGILEKEAPIHVSNLMVIDPQTDQPTRVGRTRLADGSVSRVAKKSGATMS